MMQSKTWWGKRFIQALETFTDSSRLSRGRAYSKTDRIIKWQLIKGEVQANVLGNVNPYFEIYEAPIYRTKLQMTPISANDWKKVIKLLSVRSGFIVKLMMDEMPENIEDIFEELALNFLPRNYHDFSVKCSCPDYAVPCKHIAGICYRLGQLMDSDPMLLFELRGLPTDKLKQELSKSSLGKVLVRAMQETAIEPEPVMSYYTRPIMSECPDKITPHDFWVGNNPLPKETPSPTETQISAILLKKRGDYPSFWNKQTSFIDVMEEFYNRVRKNSFTIK